MSRRGFFGVIAGTAAALGIGGMVPKRKYGPMTIERHWALSRQGTILHVFHKGQDITRRCRFADDTGDGMAEVRMHNDKGHWYETVHGITMEPGEPLS